MTKVNVIKPQEGYQEKALSSSADIVIGGGAAGAGKTFTLLLEPLRHVHIKKFNAVCFRRTSTMITGEGGLWDTAKEIYLKLGATTNESSLRFRFNEMSSIKFSHLQYEKDLQNWQGNQICLLLFDELTQFTEKQFFYLLSRNRSDCGVRPYVRATCNPDPDSWVKRFIQWWIDKETGYPIPERDGVIRYFCNDGGNYIWGDTRKEVLEQVPHLIEQYKEVENFDERTIIKSVTFVAGSIAHNKKLLQVNPEYLGNLNALDEADKKALLGGNWNAVSNEDMIFDLHKLNQIEFNSWNWEDRDSKSKDKFITADIALMGSDMLVLFVWQGFTIIDAIFVKESIEADKCLQIIIELSKKHQIPRQHISFDRDGIGAFLKGFLSFSHDIVNNSKCLFKENYSNLKAQMFFQTSKIIEDIYILPEIANQKIGSERMIDVLKKHLRAIRKRKNPDDNKLGLNKKEEQKNILGCSPDLADAFAQRGYFYKIYNK